LVDIILYITETYHLVILFVWFRGVFLQCFFSFDILSVFSYSLSGLVICIECAALQKKKFSEEVPLTSTMMIDVIKQPFQLLEYFSADV
jgi:hypothetical protein